MRLVTHNEDRGKPLWEIVRSRRWIAVISDLEEITFRRVLPGESFGVAVPEADDGHDPVRLLILGDTDIRTSCTAMDQDGVLVYELKRVHEVKLENGGESLVLLSAEYERA